MISFVELAVLGSLSCPTSFNVEQKRREKPR
jgi:hypothetical protein